MVSTRPVASSWTTIGATPPMFGEVALQNVDADAVAATLSLDGVGVLGEDPATRLSRQVVAGGHQVTRRHEHGTGTGRHPESVGHRHFSLPGLCMIISEIDQSYGLSLNDSSAVRASTGFHTVVLFGQVGGGDVRREGALARHRRARPLA